MKIDEEQVRRTMHRQAEQVEPVDGSWTRIQTGVDAARRRRRLRSGGLTGLATAAVVALVFATVSLVPDDASRLVETGPAATTEKPDEGGAPASAPSPPPPASDDRPVDEAHAANVVAGIWPLRSGAEVDAYRAAGTTRYDDPVAVARAFAVEYLGMSDPVVGEPTDRQTGTVEVILRPRGAAGSPLPAGAMDTTVVLASFGRGGPTGPGGPWTVLSTTSSNIRLDDVADRGVTSPLSIGGQSRAFEGTVQVEVREDAMEAGEAL